MTTCVSRHNIFYMRPSTKAAVFALLVALGITLFAEPISQLKATGYVNDFAQTLDSTTSAQLNDVCQQIDQKAHAQIAVVTIKSLDGNSIEDYAVTLFKQWGIGSKATNRGVLILLAVQDHRYRIEVGYGLEPILPDGKVGGFGREAVPLLKANDYSGAVALMTSRVAEVIAQDAGVELTGARVPTVPQGGQNPGFSAGGIFLAIIVILIVLFTPLRGILFWLLLSGAGRGFGGGGGGFSGGGGASGSW